MQGVPVQGGEALKHTCMNCGADLCSDEIALYRKLVFRGATEYLCLDCLARELSFSRDRLQKLIDYYHRTGLCCLFAKTEDD